MTIRFQGFPPTAFEFLEKLEAHNTKEWFHEQRDVYDSSLRGPMNALVYALNEELAGFAPAYRVSDPRRAISRPNRDTRFSSDKRPYRTEISAVLPRDGGPKHAVAGFFFSVGAAGIDVLGGAYMPATPELTALRRFLVARVEPFRRVVDEIEATHLVGTLQGEQTRRVPAGFSAEGAAADLVRYKQFYFRVRLDTAVALSDRLVRELSQRFRIMSPFVELLDEGLKETRA